jgi:hypothetical protein
MIRLTMPIGCYAATIRGVLGPLATRKTVSKGQNGTRAGLPELGAPVN